MQLGGALLYLGLRTGAGCAAPVEQRQGQLQLPTARGITVAAIAVGGGVAAVGHADIAKHGTRTAPALAGGLGVELAAGGLHIKALAQRGGFDAVCRQGVGGQWGQWCCQAVLRLQPPHAHAAVELLAFGGGGQAGAGQLGAGVVQHGLFARLLQATPVAHAHHAAGQLGPGLGGFDHALVCCSHLLGGHGAQPGAAGIKGQRDHVLRRLQRGDLQALGLPRRAPGQGDEVEHAESQRALNLALMAVGKAPQSQVRIGQRDGLHPFGIGYAQRGQPGVQPGVVEQCNAHGGILRDGLGQPVVDGLLRLGAGGRVGGGQGGFCAPGAACRERGHVAAQAVGCDAGAARQHGRSAQQGRAMEGIHGLPPCIGMWWRMGWVPGPECG